MHKENKLGMAKNCIYVDAIFQCSIQGYFLERLGTTYAYNIKCMTMADCTKF